MTLSSANGKNLATFRAEEFQQMYHLLESVKHMDSLFYATHSYVSARYIVKHWVKYLLKFRQMPTHVYNTKSLRKTYQFLIIYACIIYGQEST